MYEGKWKDLGEAFFEQKRNSLDGFNANNSSTTSTNKSSSASTNNSPGRPDSTLLTSHICNTAAREKRFYLYDQKL